MLIYRIVYVLYFEKLITTLEKFQMICNNGSMRTKLRGVLMAGKPATKQENTVGWDFDRYNDEFVQPAHTVGCAYLPNSENVVALKKSGGSESLYSEKTALTPLSTLTTATNEAETRMNTVFSGGGGANLTA